MVPWADDLVANQRSFNERGSVMSASSRDRVALPIDAGQQNRSFAYPELLHFSVVDLRQFAQHNLAFAHISPRESLLGVPSGRVSSLDISPSYCEPLPAAARSPLSRGQNAAMPQTSGGYSTSILFDKA